MPVAEVFGARHHIATVRTTLLQVLSTGGHVPSVPEDARTKPKLVEGSKMKVYGLYTDTSDFDTCFDLIGLFNTPEEAMSKRNDPKRPWRTRPSASISTWVRADGIYLVVELEVGKIIAAEIYDSLYI